EPRREDGDYPGVGVEDRLARAVGARVAQRDGRYARLAAPAEHEPLLVHLGEHVREVAAADRGLLGRRGRLGRPVADRAVDAPVAALELSERPGRRELAPVHGADDRALR